MSVLWALVNWGDQFRNITASNGYKVSVLSQDGGVCWLVNRLVIADCFWVHGDLLNSKVWYMN
jgi:hypothetical protein